MAPSECAGSTLERLDVIERVRGQGRDELRHHRKEMDLVLPLETKNYEARVFPRRMGADVTEALVEGD